MEHVGLGTYTVLLLDQMILFFIDWKCKMRSTKHTEELCDYKTRYLNTIDAEIDVLTQRYDQTQNIEIRIHAVLTRIEADGIISSIRHSKTNELLKNTSKKKRYRLSLQINLRNEKKNKYPKIL
jgi:hypothetical protein